MILELKTALQYCDTVVPDTLADAELSNMALAVAQQVWLEASNGLWICTIFLLRLLSLDGDFLSLLCQVVPRMRAG